MGESMEMIAVIIAALVAVGGYVMRDRQVWKAIRDTEREARDRIDQVRDTHVRQIEFNAHITRLEKSNDDLRGEIRHLRESIERMFEAFPHKS